VAASVVKIGGTACPSCRTLMVAGPEGLRCLNCGAVVRVGPPTTPIPGSIHIVRMDTAAIADEVARAADLVEQMAAALQDQHHAIATALGMSPAEPFPVLLARMKAQAADARRWVALAGMVADSLPKAPVHRGKGR
jgi:hypothetical protein